MIEVFINFFLGGLHSQKDHEQSFVWCLMIDSDKKGWFFFVGKELMFEIMVFEKLLFHFYDGQKLVNCFWIILC